MNRTYFQMITLQLSKDAQRPKRPAAVGVQATQAKVPKVDATAPAEAPEAEMLPVPEGG